MLLWRQSVFHLVMKINIEIRKGLWVSGLYGSSNQGMINKTAGYKGRSAGGSIGFDFSPTDESLIGIAYSNINTNLKYKKY